MGRAEPLLSNINYNRNLNCGECIAGGYNYCWKTRDPSKVLSDSEFPSYQESRSATESICCRNAEDRDNCPDIAVGLQGRTREWTCSSSYRDSIYKFNSCPFQKSSCGPFN